MKKMEEERIEQFAPVEETTSVEQAAPVEENEPVGKPAADRTAAASLAGLAKALGRLSPDRDTAFEALRRREADRVFREDLAAIRAAWPDETAASVRELGPQFAAICAAGVEPLAAYEALRAQRQRRAAPSTGRVAAGGGDGTYFSRDEVARMSREEIHRNFDRIRRSMRRW